jgi:hypothetical protein
LIAKNTIVEYARNRSVPIVHWPGEVTMEASQTAHWLRNESKAVVERYSTIPRPLTSQET